MDIKLNSKVILEKEFKKSVKGYNIEQVDQFLDEIIEDYDTFEKIIEELQQENRQLKEQLELASRKQQQQQKVTTQVGSTNFDILQRLSNLEKHVFGSKLYE